MQQPPSAAGKRPAWHGWGLGVVALGLVIGVGVVVRSISDSSDESGGIATGDDRELQPTTSSIALPPGYTASQVDAFVTDVDETRPGLPRRDHEIMLEAAAGMCDTLRQNATANSEILDGASAGPPAEVANRFTFPYLLGIFFDARPEVAPFWMSRGAKHLCPEYAADVYSFLVGRGAVVPP